MLILAKINEIGDMMGLMIYNSLTNKIEEFKTHEPGIVNMYVCGPTVYDYIHIGNARPVIFYDMLKNYLEYIGYKVNYASNITDVDDKIINKALEQGVSEEEIAKNMRMHILKIVMTWVLKDQPLFLTRQRILKKCLILLVS